MGKVHPLKKLLFHNWYTLYIICLFAINFMGLGQVTLFDLVLTMEKIIFLVFSPNIPKFSINL